MKPIGVVEPIKAVSVHLPSMHQMEALPSSIPFLQVVRVQPTSVFILRNAFC